jgi:hypothetical protein
MLEIKPGLYYFPSHDKKNNRTAEKDIGDAVGKNPNQPGKSVNGDKTYDEIDDRGA